MYARKVLALSLVLLAIVCQATPIARPWSSNLAPKPEPPLALLEVGSQVQLQAEVSRSCKQPQITCCQGKICPYKFGVCCPGVTHCCPQQSSCVQVTGSEQFRCRLNRFGKALHQHPISAPDVRVRKAVIKVAAKPKPPVIKIKPPPPAPKPVPEPNLPGQIPWHKQKLPDLPPPNKLPPFKRPDIKIPMLENEYRRMAIWPPLPAITDDGKSGMWQEEKKIDWRGFGLIRNGTHNIVKDMETCQDQCQMMTECRLLMYNFVTRECWLDTKYGDVPRECPMSRVNSSTIPQADCVTYFKKTTEEELQQPQYGPTSMDEDKWIRVEEQNWNGPAHRSLLRNGRRNVVWNEKACVAQCARLAYCRTLVYFRPTKECWLSSQLGHGGVTCAQRLGKRDCVSWVKKPIKPALEYIRESLWTAYNKKLANLSQYDSDINATVTRVGRDKIQVQLAIPDKEDEPDKPMKVLPQDG